MPSPYYGTSLTSTSVAYSWGWSDDWRTTYTPPSECTDKLLFALLTARDKRERKARRHRMVIAGMARQQGLQARAAIRERGFRRGKRQIPDRLAQRCRRVFR